MIRITKEIAYRGVSKWLHIMERGVDHHSLTIKKKNIQERGEMNEDHHTKCFNNTLKFNMFINGYVFNKALNGWCIVLYMEH